LEQLGASLQQEEIQQEDRCREKTGHEEGKIQEKETVVAERGQAADA